MISTVDFPDIVRYFTDTICGEILLPDLMPRCYSTRNNSELAEYLAGSALSCLFAL